MSEANATIYYFYNRLQKWAQWCLRREISLEWVCTKVSTGKTDGRDGSVSKAQHDEWRLFHTKGRERTKQADVVNFGKMQ